MILNSTLRPKTATFKEPYESWRVPAVLRQGKTGVLTVTWFFTVGGSIILGPPSLQKSSNAWLQANGGSTVSRWDRQPASWTMKNLPRMTEVSSPKVSTLAFLLVPFFLVRKLHEIKGHSLMEFSQHVSNMYPSVKSHATKSGGLDAPFFCLQTFWHRTLPSPNLPFSGVVWKAKNPKQKFRHRQRHQGLQGGPP